ncbi:MAG: hypothetical protein C5B51_23055 [Terriglobia bacterium]|nr:MAG: hypothetical protein C5B51_23055 [Terriglobia bacterium]
METGRTQETQKTDHSHGSRPAADASGDRVELSSTLGRIAHAISSFNAQRSNKIQSLTAEYQAGRYRPDSSATSRAMISDSLGAERAGA